MATDQISFYDESLKETDRGLLRIGWQGNPCLFRIRL
jgi:hypothetical protein